jgi:hypothetical protein
MAVVSEIGNREHIFFWTDRWIHGKSILDLAPLLFAAIPQRRRRQRLVKEALHNRTWISDIWGALTVGIIVEFLHLWEVLDELLLQPEVEDSHSCRLGSNGLYPAKSCYESLFLRAISFKPCERI